MVLTILRVVREQRGPNYGFRDLVRDRFPGNIRRYRPGGKSFIACGVGGAESPHRLRRRRERSHFHRSVIRRQRSTISCSRQIPQTLPTTPPQQHQQRRTLRGPRRPGQHRRRQQHRGHTLDFFDHTARYSIRRRRRHTHHLSGRQERHLIGRRHKLTNPLRTLCRTARRGRLSRI